MTSATIATQPRTLAAPPQTFHTFSAAAQDELASYVDTLDRGQPEGRVDDLAVDLRAVPLFTAEVEDTRRVIDASPHFVVYDRVSGVDTLRGQAIYTWVLGHALGTPMVQNTDGWRLIEVYDRGTGRTIAEGARYHQTRQGSYMHNDAVNDVDPIDYLLLSCGQAALVGGESILVDAVAVHEALRAHPEVLAELEREFWFEKRGMALEPEFFRSPIIRYSPDGTALVRYFRTYIEVAHDKLGEPLSEATAAALDIFDAVMDQSSVQIRVRLDQGQILVSADDRFLHTRTAFADRRPPRPIDMRTDRPQDVNRYMFRMWSTKQPAN